MSNHQQEKEQDVPKPKSPQTINDNDEHEPTLEEIEQELDKIRPKLPSPEEKLRIEKEQKKKGHGMEHKKAHNENITVHKTESSDEHKHDHNIQHGEHDLTPGEPDPSVNDNLKIPVMDVSGHIEFKPQQGSKINKH